MIDLLVNNHMYVTTPKKQFKLNASLYYNQNQNIPMAYYAELPSLHNLYADAAMFDVECSPAHERLVSHTLSMHLGEMKEQIKECGEDAWDTMKKYTNPF